MAYYNIAGLIVEMNCSGRTALQALPYRIEHCEKVDICISDEYIKQTIQYLNDEFNDVDYDLSEYLATGGIFYLYLLQHNGFMLHSSAVVIDDKAYLFTADSGTGKSTHTELWLKQFGDRAYILNDDKPALRLINNKWYAYGTPWSGKNDQSQNRSVELGGIAVLERAENNTISPFEGIDAISAILKQVNRSKLPENRLKLMELLDHLITNIPIWKLQCNMEPEAALVAYNAMVNQL